MKQEQPPKIEKQKGWNISEAEKEILNPKNEELENETIKKILELTPANFNEEEMKNFTNILKNSKPPILKYETLYKSIRHVTELLYNIYFRTNNYDVDRCRNNNGVRSYDQSGETFSNYLISYFSNDVKDKETGESTADRSFKIITSLPERYKEFVSLIFQTGYATTNVRPETFFSCYEDSYEGKTEAGYNYTGDFYDEVIFYIGKTSEYKERIISLFNLIKTNDLNDIDKSSYYLDIIFYILKEAAQGEYYSKYNVIEEIIKNLNNVSNKFDTLYFYSSKIKYQLNKFENRLDEYEDFYWAYKRREKEDEEKKEGKKEENVLVLNTIGSYINNDDKCINKISRDMISVYDYDDFYETKKNFKIGIIDEKMLNRLSEINKKIMEAFRKYDMLSPEGIEIIIKENNLTSLVEESNNIRNEIYLKVNPISTENILYNKKNIISNKDLDDFIDFFNSEFVNFIEYDLNISLIKLKLKEQYYLFQIFKTSTNESIAPLKKFSNKYKESGLRTFFSVAYGGQKMGDKILTIGEKLPEEVASKVFSIYGEIIDNVNKIVEFTRTKFKDEIETNPELIQKIEETLYIKGEQLLSQIYKDVDNDKEVNINEISNELNRINADTLTTFAIFKQASRNGEKLSLENIEGAVFSRKEATNIEEEQQSEMLQLYQTNWKNHPDQNFVESLKTYFKTAFNPEENKEKNYFYTFEKDGNTRAFVRFEEQKDGLYASALNVDEASKSFGLGEAMMDEALIQEAKENILHASCRKDNPSNMRYFEKGFISKGFKKTNETEEFDLVWDEEKNKDILAKQKTQEELINMYGNTIDEDIEIKKSDNLERLNDSIPEGKSLVRCFLNNGEWYAVYETVKEGYGVKEGETK